jgi:hypothetical protein
MTCDEPGVELGMNRCGFSEGEKRRTMKSGVLEEEGQPFTGNKPEKVEDEWGIRRVHVDRGRLVDHHVLPRNRVLLRILVHVFVASVRRQNKRGFGHLRRELGTTERATGFDGHIGKCHTTLDLLLPFSKERMRDDDEIGSSAVGGRDRLGKKVTRRMGREFGGEWMVRRSDRMGRRERMTTRR